ncbi:PDZ domain (Also known as DHR or GLGF) domain-containing protein [Ditylenchus destructor]|uniref:PDZ domain (Also known as DHR or GLGF) domain-containing protein n=1 Tax=Ditylenchus destructor TaxID=166010 RepID=A0AAD4RD05_9BILA|nr:PDZ domain (Also known as DHR or GLGF) domain-containing protein [Ditylenchus destructor]
MDIRACFVRYLRTLSCVAKKPDDGNGYKAKKLRCCGCLKSDDKPFKTVELNRAEEIEAPQFGTDENLDTSISHGQTEESSSEHARPISRLKRFQCLDSLISGRVNPNIFRNFDSHSTPTQDSSSISTVGVYKICEESSQTTTGSSVDSTVASSTLISTTDYTTSSPSSAITVESMARRVRLRHWKHLRKKMRQKQGNRERNLAMSLNAAAAAQKQEGLQKASCEFPLKHRIVGFLRRTSHLSLTSGFSSDASYYLIGKILWGHRNRRVGAGGIMTPFEDSTIYTESDARLFSDDESRVSTSTDNITSVSRQHHNLYRRRRRQYHRRQPSRASSMSSMTETSMALEVITVTLNMDTVNFLGISIVGQSCSRGDNGIYVANVMPGGAVALDGRVEPGDMILQVNDISFENFTNDQAVEVLKEAVNKRGPIKLTVAKSFDGGRSNYFMVPSREPVRPIDTQAWVQHTNAVRGIMGSIPEGSEGAPTPIPGVRPGTSSSTTATSNGSGGGQTTVVGPGGTGMPYIAMPPPQEQLSIHTDKRLVVQTMAMPNSGLDEKLIAHVVNKITFTEQCYYVFGEQCAEFVRLRTASEEGSARGGYQQQQMPLHATIASTSGNGWVNQQQPHMHQIARSMVSEYASMPPMPSPYPGQPQQQYNMTGGNPYFQQAQIHHQINQHPRVGGPDSQASNNSNEGGNSSSGGGSSEQNRRKAVLPPAPSVSSSVPIHPGSVLPGGGQHYTTNQGRLAGQQPHPAIFMEERSEGKLSRFRIRNYNEDFFVDHL